MKEQYMAHLAKICVMQEVSNEEKEASELLQLVLAAGTVAIILFFYSI